jgi:hypothetical protein
MCGPPKKVWTSCDDKKRGNCWFYSPCSTACGGLVSLAVFSVSIPCGILAGTALSLKDCSMFAVKKSKEYSDNRAELQAEAKIVEEIRFWN